MEKSVFRGGYVESERERDNGALVIIAWCVPSVTPKKVCLSAGIVGLCGGYNIEQSYKFRCGMVGMNCI